jgi:hypothetical protein
MIRPGWWNYELLHRIFDLGEVARICSVVVSHLGQSDWLVWRGSTDGLFSVKSAYHMAISRRAQEKGERSREAADCRIWKSIWRLRVPPVARHFCWKVCHNLLPTMVNLTAKKIVANLECPICSREPETASSALLVELSFSSDCVARE